MWQAASNAPWKVPEALRGKGHGRRLARTARALAPRNSRIWAQVTPCNADSLRTFLAAGYLPVGSEPSSSLPAREGASHHHGSP
ncbi:GNAT family N-acetyltransferase [Kribbella catacumbae]|uniref:GNAT family N-acetyltransferase n=1 Tax=Kribbella catacumbae TaxID=460086 RepID=UPI00307C94B4